MSEEKPFVLGLCISKEDDAYLKQVVSPVANVVSSMEPLTASPTNVNLYAAFSAVTSVTPIASRLVPGFDWPTSYHTMVDALGMRTESPRHWLFKSLVTVAATGVLVYAVDELTVRSPDVTAVLTAARMMGAMTIGILPADARGSLDITQLTFTDAVVGAVEPRALGALLRSLKEAGSNG